MKYLFENLGKNCFQINISFKIFGFLKSMKYQYVSFRKALIRADKNNISSLLF